MLVRRHANGQNLAHFFEDSVGFVSLKNIFGGTFRSRQKGIRFHPAKPVSIW